MTSYAWTMHRTRVRCMVTCKCCGMTRPCIDRSIARDEVATASGDGDDVEVSTKESFAHDFGDSNDSSCYFCESLIFSGLLWMQPCTEPPSSERETMDGVQGFQLEAACEPQDTMGTLNLKHYMFRRGV